VTTPERIAEHVVDSVERDRGETTVPRYYAAAGLLQALTPNLVARSLARAGERTRIAR
jgi:hypothetical protein